MDFDNSNGVNAPVEREAKVPVPDLAPAEARLRSVGAVHQGKVREQNWVLDDVQGSLRGRGMLLRLREHVGEPGGVITVKYPMADGEFKTRGELETRVDDIKTALAQFELLGYRKSFYYEKDRDAWEWRGCHIALDRLPGIGCFVEVEGTEEGIRGVLTELGVDPAASVKMNYLGLWEEYCKKHGLSRRDMRFD